VDGNYSPGPFRKLPGVPEAMKDCPTVLPQKGIAVTAVKKESLPSGTQVHLRFVCERGGQVFALLLFLIFEFVL
jgi:hypothetical protein